MNDSTPSVASSWRRILCGFSIAENAAGERLPVIANFPAHVDDAAGLAALVEGAAVDAGMSAVRFLQRIAAALPPPIGEVEYAPRAAHRPSCDWKAEHGAHLVELWDMALNLRAANPKMAKIKSFGAALQEARKSAKLSLLPEATEGAEAERLKQACRRLPTRVYARGEVSPKSSSRFST